MEAFKPSGGPTRGQRGTVASVGELKPAVESLRSVYLSPGWDGLPAEQVLSAFLEGRVEIVGIVTRATSRRRESQRPSPLTGNGAFAPAGLRLPRPPPSRRGQAVRGLGFQTFGTSGVYRG